MLHGKRGKAALVYAFAVVDTTDFLRANPIGHTQFLIEKAKGGSETAWREIHRRYRTMLALNVRGRMHGVSSADVEELLQRVLAKSWQHIAKFDYKGEGSFRRWLATLVVNECRNEITSRERHGTEARELTEVEDVAGSHSEEASAERRALIEKMAELSDYDRDLLIMRDFEKMSWDAIAEALRCSIEKAKRDYETALQRLSRKMKS